ncbi:Hypothetical predicted protein [Olea europaea subsp. europaea]|uniref:Uncharacterized protein n=1 Tax=Olea europaea subsp. europaea TaxID=158383 RepID=A0A8S0Q0J6_OLEEU|nr:Hypothetical predicted protein [Olea europaea subsp. europaea]
MEVEFTVAWEKYLHHYFDPTFDVDYGKERLIMNENKHAQSHLKLQDNLHILFVASSSGRRRLRSGKATSWRSYESDPELNPGMSQVEVKVENPISGNGDWKDDETAPRLGKSAGSLKIIERGERPLHIAALAKQTAFAHELVKQLDKEDLKLLNDYGHTTFYFAAISGVVEIAEAI